jgi:hypothetical protein
MDMPEARENFRSFQGKMALSPLAISCHTGDGLEFLQKHLLDFTSQAFYDRDSGGGIAKNPLISREGTASRPKS